MSDAMSAGVSPAPSPVPASSTPASEARSDAPAVPSFKGTKHRVKIGGEEREVDYDELVTDYQTRQAADVKFRDAARLMKEAGATKAQIEAFTQTPEFAKARDEVGIRAVMAESETVRVWVSEVFNDESEL